MQGKPCEGCLSLEGKPTFKGHHSGLQGMWVKKLGRALRPMPGMPLKGLLPAALPGPQPAPCTPPGMSLSATVCSNAFVACAQALYQ